MVYVKYHDFIATANISVLNTEISVLKVGIPRLMWSVFRAARMEILPVLLSSNTTNLHRLYETVIDFICIISKLNTVDTDHIAVHQLVPLTSFSQATVRHACNA